MKKTIRRLITVVVYYKMYVNNSNTPFVCVVVYLNKYNRESENL